MGINKTSIKFSLGFLAIIVVALFFQYEVVSYSGADQTNVPVLSSPPKGN